MSRIAAHRPAILALALTAPLVLATPALAVEGMQAHSQHAHQHAAFESGRIHVRVDGPEGAPDIVLIPGLSSSPRIWQDTVDHLLPHYRIHRIHVQGFGGAESKDNAQTGDAPQPFIAPVSEEIARYIREAGLDKPAVIGHSLGGTLAMTLASQHPDAVSKVMVVDMMPFLGVVFGPPGTTVESVKPTAQMVWATQTGLSRQAYDDAATATITGMINTESRREEALADARNSDQRVSAAAYHDLIITDLRGDLPKITVPMTVLYVKFNDARTTEAVTDMIYTASYASRPQTTLKRIDDSAHFIMFDQPEVFTAEIDAFLKSN